MLFKVDILSIVIYPFGGMCYVNKKINNRILYDVLINIGGILMQLVLFIIVRYLWKIGIIIDSTYVMFNKYNMSIMLFNMLPIIPLDGSKLILNIFSKYVSFRLSYVIMIIISIVFSLLFILFNIVYGINDMIVYGFLLFKVIEVIKEYRYVIGKFYLERIIYDNYYDGIINDCNNVKNMKIGKYYYFYNNGRYVSEKDYLKYLNNC
jgi:stage IV sporulation protein FB